MGAGISDDEGWEMFLDIPPGGGGGKSAEALDIFGCLLYLDSFSRYMFFNEYAMLRTNGCVNKLPIWGF